MKELKQFRWFLLVTGILILLLGLFMFTTPLENLVAVAIFIALAMLLSGISEIVCFFSEDKTGRSTWLLASGILSMLFGMWVLFGSGMPAMVVALPLIFAIWILTGGIMRSIGAFKLKEVGVGSWWIILIIGLLSAVLGFILMFSPVMSAFVAAYTLAFIITLHGLNNIFIFFTLR